MKWDLVRSKKANTLLLKRSDKDGKTLARLQEELRKARLSKDSSNSSRPPSTDLYKPKRNKNLSLRKKSGKKTGGQPRQKGSTLTFCTDKPDDIITHSPEVCASCGGNLEMVAGEVGQIYQVIDIKVPPTMLINHQSIVKRCSCGKCNKGTFPPGVLGIVNYGRGIRALVVNLSVRQYIPCGRIVEVPDKKGPEAWELQLLLEGIIVERVRGKP
jgi:transposase